VSARAATALSLVILAVYIIGSGRLVSTGGSWYQSLTRPPWQPPDVAFGIAWPYNFITLGFVGFVVAHGEHTRDRGWWLACFAISVVAALTWARLFYVHHALTASGIALGVAAVATVPMVVLAFRASTLGGFAMIPYNIWLAIATSLAFGYASRN